MRTLMICLQDTRSSLVSTMFSSVSAVQESKWSLLYGDDDHPLAIWLRIQQWPHDFLLCKSGAQFLKSRCHLAEIRQNFCSTLEKAFVYQKHAEAGLPLRDHATPIQKPRCKRPIWKFQHDKAKAMRTWNKMKPHTPLLNWLVNHGKPHISLEKIVGSHGFFLKPILWIAQHCLNQGPMLFSICVYVRYAMICQNVRCPQFISHALLPLIFAFFVFGSKQRTHPNKAQLIIL
jgi:hypothetical protein